MPLDRLRRNGIEFIHINVCRRHSVLRAVTMVLNEPDTLHGPQLQAGALGKNRQERKTLANRTKLT